MTAPTALPDRLPYRLLTGVGDRAFCERVSEAVLDGWVLYGEPILLHGPDGLVSGQAVVLPEGSDDG